MRRIAGLAIAALLLQFNLVPRDVGCADHVQHQAESASQHVLQEEPAHHDHQSTDESTPCAPDVDCCESVGACSASHAIGASQAETSSAPVYEPVSAFRGSSPAYLIRAPELPPPKA